MIVFASRNVGKINECKSILSDFDIKSLIDLDIDIDIDENGETFYDNALIKAKSIYDIVKCPVISDDTGLIMESYGNWPGVNTKRISNDMSFDERDRNNILIDKGKLTDNKNIKSVCCVVYYDGVNIISCVGETHGTITDREYPGNGFGFDRIFRLSDGRVMSELTSEEKNMISHRAKALNELKKKLKN